MKMGLLPIGTETPDEAGSDGQTVPDHGRQYLGQVDDVGKHNRVGDQARIFQLLGVVASAVRNVGVAGYAQVLATPRHVYSLMLLRLVASGPGPLLP